MRNGGHVTISLDAAVKTNPQNDYSVATVWLAQDGNHHLLEVWRDKVTYPDLVKKLTNLCWRHQPDTLLIEDAASGSALIQSMKARGVPAIGRACSDSKMSRMISASAYFEAGQVWLPKDAVWRAAYETELLGFPGGRHDDQVDSTTQYLCWWHERPTSYFYYEWM